jgi:hypothetical protein
MPYSVKKVGDQFCVVKKDDGKRMGCHATEDRAKAQMRALYAAEGAPEGPVSTTVQEQLGAVEAVWTDNAEGLPQADVVIIRPGESLNRRYYPREAIEEAVRTGFWDNTPMFLNHGDRAMPRKRNLEHLKARIEKGTTYVGAEGEARGRVTFIDPEFAKFIRNAGESAGLSAVLEFMGQRYRGNDGHMHERVNKLVANHSVDFVAYPAAGGGIAQFLPAQESEEDVDWTKVTPEMLKEHRPDLVAMLAAEADDGDDDKTDEGNPKAPFPAPVPQPRPEPKPEEYVSRDEALRLAQEAADRVVTTFQERERKIADTRTKVTAHVTKSGLPERAKGKVLTAFEGQEEYDQTAVQEAIDDMAETLKETGWRGPRVVGIGASEAQETDDKGEDPETLSKLYPTMMAVEQELTFRPRSDRKVTGAN